MFGCIGSIVLCTGLITGIGCSGGGSKGGNTAVSSSSKEITSFEIISPITAVGIIDESAKKISIAVPYGTSPANLVAKFSTTGVRTSISSTEQTSEVTENDFSNSLTYTVTAADGTINQYTITVSITPASTENNLASLVLSSGTVSPAFDSGTASYTSSVDNTVSSMTVTPTFSDATSSITVNTITVKSGTASGLIPP